MPPASPATASTSKSALALHQVLKNHTASEIESSCNVIELDANTTPIEAAKLLWKHNFLGAPVYDKKNKTYLGFFDVRDILSTVIATHKEYELRKASVPSSMAKWSDRFTVETSYLARRNPFVSCKADASLEHVCRLLQQHRCHRIPVVDKDGHCQGIISQSALVKFLVDHVKDDLTETLDEAHFDYKKQVLSVTDTTQAIQAFELLDSKRLSGIAVVDEEDGRLVGNTSARDIKMVVLNDNPHANIDMEQDILTYLAAVRQATPTKKERFPSAHVSQTSTIGHAIRLLAKTGYHRVFVVDKQIRPIGVISVADIIDFVVGSN